VIPQQVAKRRTTKKTWWNGVDRANGGLARSENSLASLGTGGIGNHDHFSDLRAPSDIYESIMSGRGA
jgi:hypothetical protein